MTDHRIHVDTGSPLTTVTKNDGNPFDSTFILGCKYRKIDKITLRDVQMPIGFYNVRFPYNTFTLYYNYAYYSVPNGTYTASSLVNNAFSSFTGYFYLVSLPIPGFNVPAGVYTINTLTILLTSLLGSSPVTVSGLSVYTSLFTIYTVTPGNYAITTLVNTINTLLTTQIGTLSVSPLTNTMLFTSSIGQVTLSGALASFLGFAPSNPSTVVSAPYSYIINFDTHVYLFFPQFGNASGENILGTFKIAVNVPQGGILMWPDLTENIQSVEMIDDFTTIDRIIVQVRDRYGNILNNNGIDWSFTIELLAHECISSGYESTSQTTTMITAPTIPIAGTITGFTATYNQGSGITLAWTGTNLSTVSISGTLAAYSTPNSYFSNPTSGSLIIPESGFSYGTTYSFNITPVASVITTNATVSVPAGSISTFTSSYNSGTGISLAWTGTNLALGVSISLTFGSISGFIFPATYLSSDTGGNLVIPTGFSFGQPYTFTIIPINGTSSSSTSVTPTVPILYPFTSQTFTSAGVTGPTGPTLSQCQAAYSSSPWTSNPAYFDMITQGYQIWTVPRTGTYLFVVTGGSGGYWSDFTARVPGLGAVMCGPVNLTVGQKLIIIVGQSALTATQAGYAQYTRPGRGGGGGTFVIDSANTNFPLIAAAGGSGVAWYTAGSAGAMPGLMPPTQPSDLYYDYNTPGNAGVDTVAGDNTAASGYSQSPANSAGNFTNGFAGGTNAYGALSAGGFGGGGPGGLNSTTSVKSGAGGGYVGGVQNVTGAGNAVAYPGVSYVDKILCPRVSLTPIGYGNMWNAFTLTFGNNPSGFVAIQYMPTTFSGPINITFTNCGGLYGTPPTQAQIQSTYQTAQPTLWNNMYPGIWCGYQGFQVWVVPVSGIYTITAAGACGGSVPNETSPTSYGGPGGIVTASYNLQLGDLIIIAVGQIGAPNAYAGPGGGMTAVLLNGASGPLTSNTSYYPLLVGGGGAGGNSAGVTGRAPNIINTVPDQSILRPTGNGLGQAAGLFANNSRSFSINQSSNFPLTGSGSFGGSGRPGGVNNSAGSGGGYSAGGGTSTGTNAQASTAVEGGTSFYYNQAPYYVSGSFSSSTAALQSNGYVNIVLN